MKSLFELGYVIEAIDRASGVIKRVEGHVKHLDGAVGKSGSAWSRTFSHVNAGLESVGKSLMKVGTGGIALGGAAALGLWELVKPAMAIDAAARHAMTAMDRTEDKLGHIAELKRRMGEIQVDSIFDDAKLIQSYYIARSNAASHEAAMEAVARSVELVEGTAENADDALASLEPTTRAVTTMVNNLGQTAEYWTDSFALLQTQYAFKNITELVDALKYASPTIKQVGLDARDAFAAIAGLQIAGLHGQEAGTAFRGFVTKLAVGKKLHDVAVANERGGLDIVRTLEKLHKKLGGMKPLEVQRELKARGFGIRDVAGVALLIDKGPMLADIIRNLGNAQGVASAKAAERMAGFDFQLGRLRQNIEATKEALGTPLLESFTAKMPAVLEQMKGVVHFLESHPALVGTTMKATAIAAAVIIPLGSALLVAGAIATVLSTSVGAVAVLGALTVAVTALTTAALVNYDTSKSLGDNWQDLIDTMGGFVDAHSAAEKVLKMSLPPPTMAPLHPTLGQVIVTSDFTTSLVDAFTIDSNIYRHMGYSMATDFVSGIWDYLKSLDQSVGQMMIDGVMGIGKPSRLQQAANRTIADVAKGSWDQMLAAAHKVTLSDVYGPKLTPVLPRSTGAGVKPVAAARGTGGSVQLNYSPKITVNGAADEEQLQSMLDDHANDLMSKMETAQRRARFAEF